MASAWARGRSNGRLPDAHTDFIIAVAAEEYGLVLVLCIIALIRRHRVRSLVRLIRERDPFIRLAGTGLVVHARGAGDDQHGGGGAALARQGHDAALRQLRRLVDGGGGDAVGMLLAFTRTRPQGQIGDLLGRGEA